MIIIAEKINATRKAIAAALQAGDAQHIIDTAQQQVEAGANYIDVNGGDPRPGQEAKNMEWLMELVQANTELPVAIDSANPEAILLGLKLAKKKPILNSISLEKDRLDAMLPILSEHECMVIALLMSDAGTPATVQDRVKSATELVEKIQATGKKIEEIIVDPCFLPVSADPASGRKAIDAMAAIRRQWPKIHIGGGCSNISYGLPQRKWVNHATLVQCIYAGMDTVIINPCIPGTKELILAAEAVAGRDEFCMNYVTALR